MKAWLDHEVVSADAAMVPLSDRGFLLGDGAFETMLVRDGAIRRLDLHMQRLRQSLQWLHLPWSEDAPRAATDLANAIQNGVVRIQVTAGPMTDITGQHAVPTVSGITRPTVAAEPARLTVDSEPVEPTRAKTLSYAPHMARRRRAAVAGFSDALLQNGAGRVQEATTSNVIAICGDTLHAPGPAEGALDGTTRHLVLDAAQQLGLGFDGCLTVLDAGRADALLLCNTTSGPVAALSLDGQEFRGSKWTQKLQASYEQIAWEAP